VCVRVCVCMCDGEGEGDSKAHIFNFSSKKSQCVNGSADPQGDGISSHLTQRIGKSLANAFFKFFQRK